jgi:hypothetical protein
MSNTSIQDLGGDGRLANRTWPSKKASDSRAGLYRRPDRLGRAEPIHSGARAERLCSIVRLTAFWKPTRIIADLRSSSTVLAIVVRA